MKTQQIINELVVNLENCINVMQQALRNGKPWNHVSNDNRDSIDEVESVIAGAKYAIEQTTNKKGTK